ncbi:MAG TPA: response regulator transcription factor [Herpetosiphonaceae bacterium]|nr:response regulator transcription factor [Herpetosiphonaceae bacterium]
MEKIRVLIADDHTLFRYGLRAMLSSEADIEIAGEVTTGDEAVAAAAQLRPDVILMDINMPGISGLEATRRVARQHPEISILMLTMFDDNSVFAAIRAGARGYVLKGATGAETLRAIRAVAGGEAIFSPAIASRLMEHFASPRSTDSEQPFPELSEREREILELIAQGLTNNTIAERIYLSPKTIRNQVSNIFDKLQVHDRAEAIVRAREAGLGRGNHS